MYTRLKICAKCGHKKYHANSDDVCMDCKKVEKEEARKNHFRTLDNMTIENRIRKIEEWIYDHKHQPFPRRIS